MESLPNSFSLSPPHLQFNERMSQQVSPTHRISYENTAYHTQMRVPLGSRSVYERNRHTFVPPRSLYPSYGNLPVNVQLDIMSHMRPKDVSLTSLVSSDWKELGEYTRDVFIKRKVMDAVKNGIHSHSPFRVYMRYTREMNMASMYAFLQNIIDNLLQELNVRDGYHVSIISNILKKDVDHMYTIVLRTPSYTDMDIAYCYVKRTNLEKEYSIVDFISQDNHSIPLYHLCFQVFSTFVRYTDAPLLLYVNKHSYH